MPIQVVKLIKLWLFWSINVHRCFEIEQWYILMWHKMSTLSDSLSSAIFASPFSFCLASVRCRSSIPPSSSSSVLNPPLAHFPASFCHSPRPPGPAPHIHQSRAIKTLCSQHGGAIGRTIMETAIYGPHQVCVCVMCVCVCDLLDFS